MVPRKTNAAAYRIRQPAAMAAPRRSSNRNTISALNARCDTPTEAPRSNVAARKVLAMMVVRTLQTLNGVTVIECLDVNRLRLARPSLHVTNIPQPTFRGNRSSVLVSMTNVTATSFCICFGTCADRSHALMDRLRLHEQSRRNSSQPALNAGQDMCCAGFRYEAPIGRVR